jgi:hypothetical protein
MSVTTDSTELQQLRKNLDMSLTTNSTELQQSRKHLDMSVITDYRIIIIKEESGYVSYYWF